MLKTKTPNTSILVLVYENIYTHSNAEDKNTENKTLYYGYNADTTSRNTSTTLTLLVELLLLR